MTKVKGEKVTHGSVINSSYPLLYYFNFDNKILPVRKQICRLHEKMFLRWFKRDVYTRVLIGIVSAIKIFVTLNSYWSLCPICSY